MIVWLSFAPFGTVVRNGIVAAATIVTIFKILKYLFCCALLWSYQLI